MVRLLSVKTGQQLEHDPKFPAATAAAPDVEMA
jgi:hypothetical protein